jgi:hypothetical protein
MDKRDLVTNLRSEVRDVKDCFMRFAFQGSALATVVAGFILNANDRLEVALAAVPTIVILMLICRVGIFKYTTANRNLGYELHLDRLATYDRNGDSATKARVAEIRGIGWEEALRAWRVVQTSIFASIYKVPQVETDRSTILPRKLFRNWHWPRSMDTGLFSLKGKPHTTSQETYDPRHWGDEPFPDGPYVWWNQKKLTEHADGSGIVSYYHTGNLLKDMLVALNVMQGALFALLAWSVIQFLLDDRFNLEKRLCFSSATVFFGIFILTRQIRIQRRRVILEEELGSIHSCAISWAAIAIVHIAAAEDTRYRPYFHYTESYVFEDKNFFGPEVYIEKLLADRRLSQRRVSVVPFTRNDNRKQKERRSVA